MPPNSLLRTTLTSRPSLFLPSTTAPRTRVSYSTTSSLQNNGTEKTSKRQIAHESRTIRIKTGTVISAGLMDRTVRVLYKYNTFDKYLQKLFPATTTFMVSDPRNSLREGDVVEFSSGWRASKKVRHVVERIVAPFGSGVEERPAVMSREERVAERERKARAKLDRRSGRDADGEVVEGRPVQRVGRIKRLIEERLRNPEGREVRKDVA
ncbi:hypothetical protein FQN54_004687 [Arachnomyces sp. PD_36]|nr:hypothetical protein FQN54_004687 [Arachnomyces sp. PD_36]